MPRSARIIPLEGYLHVVCRGNNRRKIFYKPRDFKIYLKQLIKVKCEEGIWLLHYCLMPNHVHFLLGVNKESNLSRFMQRLNVKYSFYFQKRRAFVGHLWQGRFKSKIIKDELYFLQCGKYIELNPVRANLVAAPEEYTYSSYSFYALGVENDLIDEDPLYRALDERREVRQAMYRKMIFDQALTERWKT
ncbi:MAG: transposase [Candidatus Omnitrophica bacterium]|nr:transposase [Candidatus Omnitrophota bacterium]